jgi:hypothetical protein
MKSAVKQTSTLINITSVISFHLREESTRRPWSRTMNCLALRMRLNLFLVYSVARLLKVPGWRCLKRKSSERCVSNRTTTTECYRLKTLISRGWSKMKLRS